MLLFTMCASSPLTNLHLCSPLVFSRVNDAQPEPSVVQPDCEILFCFEVDPEQGKSIEPKRECFIKSLLFTGRKDAETLPGGDDCLNSETVSLPAGKYLFIQCREVLNREQWMNMAIEQQKDGLWERYQLENRLYVRYLFEDNRPVTQVFRTIKES